MSSGARRFLPTGPQLLRYGKRSLQIVGVWYCIDRWVGDVRICVGASMLPTMRAEETIAVTVKFPWLLRPPNLKLGDLVVVRSPVAPQREICKRVLGLPGDTVCVDPTGAMRGHGGWEDGASGGEHVVVPKGHVWVAGDNMSASIDSRMFGPVSLGLVVGRPVFTLYPSLGVLKNTLRELDIDAEP